MSMPRRSSRAEEPEWIVWLAVIVLLAAGLLLKNSVEGRTQNFSASGVSLSYPAEWVQLTKADQLLYAADPFSSAQFPTGVLVRQIPVTEVGRNLSTIGDFAVAWAVVEARDKQVYRTLGIEPVTVNGQEVIVVNYAYVPETAEGGQASSLPVVARAQDFLFLRNQTLTVVTLAANANVFETESDAWQAILDTVQVQ
jgi:hypothetical protein